jgi:molybdate transport system regulatory protein
MSIDGDLSASLILRRGGLARVGLERIALIEAIGGLGSISAAAKQLGLSYKGAWDGVQALNNLFDAPLVIANAGGKTGGAATVTPRGLAVIRAFRDVEREIGAALSRLEAGLAAPDPTPIKAWASCSGVLACAPARATLCAGRSRRSRTAR